MVHRAGSQGLWLGGLVPEAGIGLWMYWSRSHGILGLVLVHWWEEPAPEDLWLWGPGDPRVGVSLLVGKARAQEVLGLVPIHWWAEPCSGWLRAHGSLRQQTCWCLGLCPHLASFLASSAPGLLATGWWAGWLQFSFNLVGGVQNGAC